MMDIRRDIRGVMTRFEPLTEQALLKCGKEGLTLNELEEALARFGLSMKYVVHDPSREFQNTFYADYDKGLYSEIYLQRSYLDDLLRVGLMNYREKDGRCIHLIDGDWVRYYGQCVPLPMSIYDFQRRYLDIPSDEVFDVWHRIYQRIDFPNGMWQPEILEYVFANAPKPRLPECDANGYVTIYRGMGEKSLHVNEAISWSTNPINALWFANHSGRGTQFAVARVKPEKIVAYFPGFSDENEVILRPGTEMEVYFEKMIPSVKSEFIKLLSPALLDFIEYGSQAEGLGYKKESSPMAVHGLKHVLRVLLLSLIYYHNSGDCLTEEDCNILIYFSLLHDLGRTSEYEDETHGEKSVELIKKRGIRLKSLPLSKKGYKIAECIIRGHCLDDGKGVALIQREMHSRKDQLRAEHLFYVCKDMDGLDRVRFNGLDYRYLRTEFGRQLPLIAGGLLEEDVIGMADEIW